MHYTNGMCVCMVLIFGCRVYRLAVYIGSLVVLTMGFSGPKIDLERVIQGILLIKNCATLLLYSIKFKLKLSFFINEFYVHLIGIATSGLRIKVN